MIQRDLLCDVVLSYAPSEKATARTVQQLLSDAGTRVWFDEVDLIPGSRWDLEMRRAVSDAKAALIFIGPQPLSPWGHLEIELILERAVADPRFRVVPILLPDSGPLPVALKEYDSLDLRDVPDDYSKSLRIMAALPPAPRSLAGVLVYPASLPASLGDGFMGRGYDLVQIHARLSKRHTTTPEGNAASLVGPGGFGKTRTALEYVWRYGLPSYPGGVVWIDAEGSEASLEEQHHGILSLFTEGIPPLAVFREQKRNVRNELAACFQNTGKKIPILAVVDNVPEGDRDTPPNSLEHYLPGYPHITTLVTSRRRVPEAEPIVLTDIDWDAAVDMLRRGIESRLSQAAWVEIAEWVGRLPLALELLHESMRDGALRPAEVHQLATGQAAITKELDTVRDALVDVVPVGAVRGISEAFEASYAKLTEQAQSAARLVAQWAPAPVPMALIEPLEDLFSPTVRSALRSRSWLKAVAPQDGVEYLGAMHPVLADFLRSKSGLEESIFAALAVNRVMTPERCRAAREWPLMTALRQIGDALFDKLKQRFRTKQDGNAENDAVEALRLGLGSAILLSAQGRSRDAMQHMRKYSEFAKDVLGSEHPETLVALGNLASAMRAQGDLVEAGRLQDEVLAIRKRVLGAEHPDTLTSMSNLAGTIQAQGDLNGARRMQEEVLAIFERVLGAEHPDTLTSMNNLASTMRAQGDLHGARKMFGEVLAILRRILGGEHPNTLASMNNVAATMRAQGDLDGARKMHEEGLAILRRVLGAEHPDTLGSMHNLAATMRAQGDLDGARKMQEEVLAISRRVLGTEHPATSVSAWNVFTLLLDIGDHASAGEVFRDALAWLLHADNERLSGDQNEIRDILTQMIESASQQE